MTRVLYGQILERSQHRFEWEQFQLKQRRKVEAEEEKERGEWAALSDIIIVSYTDLCALA